MKKILYFLVVILIFSTVGCVTNDNEKNVIDIPTTDNMEFQKVEKNDKDDDDPNNDATLQVYTLKDMSREEFLEDYKKTLESQGWKTTTYSEAGFMKFEKEGREITVNTFEKDNEITINVIIENWE